MRKSRLEGWRTYQSALDHIWGTVVYNISAEAELTPEQTAKVVRIMDEVKTVLRGAEAMDMNAAEYAEYLVAKSDEVTKRLKNVWG